MTHFENFRRSRELSVHYGRRGLLTCALTNACRRSPDMDDSKQQRAAWNADLPAETRALADQLFPLFYDDLRRLAHRERHRVGAGATLQTTALVNEAYLKLRRGEGWHTDAHFLRASALAMRHALVNHAAARQAEKRGGGEDALPLQAALDVGADQNASLLALDDALSELENESPRLAHVVECRYFGGYTDAETACALGISERTVRSDWTLARAWLHRALAGEGAPNGS